MRVAVNSHALPVHKKNRIITMHLWNYNRWTDRPSMTIAVDLGRKATKPTNQLPIDKRVDSFARIIHYFTFIFTFGSRSHKIVCHLWPMHLQSLKLLPVMVKEMHIQENTLFDLWPPRSRSHKILPSTILSVLIWIQTVFKGYRQATVGKS